MNKIKEIQIIPTAQKKTKKPKNKLRENIESIVIAVAVAFAIRYLVVEAFKIPTGSMAPTLLGEHKNVKCSNCGWFFYSDRQSESATCPNCQHETSVSLYCDNCSSRISYKWPAWLWRSGSCAECKKAVPWEDLSKRVKQGGNRILVNKFWYRFSDPKRWDVVVFVYPLYDLTCKNCSEQMLDVEWQNGLRCQRCGNTKFSKQKKNYIKRLVGLPGEKLQIVNGDIYINDKIQRKPDYAQNILWMPVYDSNYLTKEEEAQNWKPDGKEWAVNKGSLALDNIQQRGTGTSFVTFGRKITDHNGYNNRSGSNEMGDVKISFDVTLASGSKCLEVVLEKNEDVFTAIIPTHDAGVRGVLKKAENVVAEKDFYVQAGKKHKIAFSNVDNMVTLSVDDNVIFRFDNDSGTVPQTRLFDSSHVRLGGWQLNAVFENIKIFHDIYYTNLSPDAWGTVKPIQLGENDYFMLGDNSRNSNDSRIWKFVPKKNIVGKAFFVFWPVDNIKFIK